MMFLWVKLFLVVMDFLANIYSLLFTLAGSAFFWMFVLVLAVIRFFAWKFPAYYDKGALWATTIIFISAVAILAFVGVDSVSDRGAGEIIYRFFVVLGIIIGFPIAIKRMNMTQKQLDDTQRQIFVSRYNGLLPMLWSDDLAQRMQGIEALWRLVQAYPQEGCKDVVGDFTNFIKLAPKLRPDAKEDITMRGRRRDTAKILDCMTKEKAEGVPFYKIDFTDLYLGQANLKNANLQGAILRRAKLNGVDLSDADLKDADLCFANFLYCLSDTEDTEKSRPREYGWGGMRLHSILVNANLAGADLRGAMLAGADLSGAELEGAKFELTVINGIKIKEGQLTEEQMKGCIFLKDCQNFHWIEMSWDKENPSRDFPFMFDPRGTPSFLLENCLKMDEQEGYEARNNLLARLREEAKLEKEG